jgi:hypothetical protein
MNINPANFSKLSKHFTETKKIPFMGFKNYELLPNDWSGTGIVIAGGGLKYGSNAYINVRYLIDVLKTELPIEIWYVGNDEYIKPIFDDLQNRYGKQIQIINALDVKKSYPFNGNLKGYPIKPYCMTHSKFETIVFLDSDCFLHLKPEDLLNTNLYKEYEALFCADIDLFYNTSGRLHVKSKNYQVPKLGTWNQHTHIWDYSKVNPIWDILGIKEDDLPEFESGLICINKSKHLDALLFSLFLNENHDITYNYVCGDKDTFKLAWSKYGNKLNLINDVRPGDKCIEGFLNNQNLYQHRVIDAKFDPNKMWSEYPNSLPCIDKGNYRLIFEELSTIIGNSLFDNSYIHNNAESLMPGSTKALSRPYIDYVQDFVSKYNIKNILDIGCGDGLMLSHLQFNKDVKITGIDVSSLAINQAKYRFKEKFNYQFFNIDASKYKNYADYGLILIKDVFQHLPYRDINHIVSLCSASQYFIICNDVPSSLHDIHRGDHRPIDITDIYSPTPMDYYEYRLPDSSQTKNIVTYRSKLEETSEI